MSTNIVASSSTSMRPANSENGEDGTVANGNGQRKKMKNTAFVQIATDPFTGPFSVVLSQKCSTLKEHADHLQAKINQSQGDILCAQLLHLDSSVILSGIRMDNSALFDYDVQLDEAAKYTFHFKLIAKDGRSAESGPKLVEKMGILEGRLEELEKRSTALEYALVIGVPVVNNLVLNYNREKMLLLIQQGNGFTKSLYVQRNQELDDEELLQSIVDLMASADKPEMMVGQVTIEFGPINFFDWPQNGHLKLKRTMSHLDIKYDEVSSTRPGTIPDCCLAEYELVNRESHFQVYLYYWQEDCFNKSVEKFIYRRVALA